MLRPLALAVILLLCPLTHAQVPATIFNQMSTPDHLKQPGWWPLNSDATRTDYVGPQVCAECHQTDARGQSKHSMAHTSMLATDSAVLKGNAAHCDDGAHAYTIYEKDGRAYYSITDQLDAITVPLLWAFGSGSVGQSYLFDYDGKLFEARMSFLQGLGFGLTPGHPTAVPPSLQFALGRPIPDDEQPKCFGCHSVASSSGGHFDISRAMLGISCEGCHGPGAAHVAIAKSGFGGTPGMIFNPARLDPPQLLDFCGACHRAYWDVADVTDIHAVRFPALRLEQSKCWGNGDARLMCTACHDPHRPLVRKAGGYDDKCLGCHQVGSFHNETADHLGSPAPVAAKNCVTCHMRKYEIPGMQLKFTDHKIRVSKEDSFEY